MKQKFLLKTMLLLCALIAGSSSVWGAEVTWERVTSISTLTSGGTFIMGYEATAKSGVIIPLRSKDSNATTTANGYFNTGTTNASSTSGTIDFSDLSEVTTSDYEIYITASSTDGYINIQRQNDTGDYYGATSGGSSSNKARLYESGNSNETNLKLEWASESDNQFKISANVSGSYKYLKYNTGSPRFAFYNSAGEKIVFYKKVVSYTAALDHIVLGGTYKTVFYTGDTFTHDGMTITAHYDDSSTLDVTASATFSSPDMSTSGVKTITVTYEESLVTKTATYDITVSPVPPVVLTLDFSTNILKLPVGNANKETTSTGYSYGGYTYTLGASSGFYYGEFTGYNCLFMGQNGSTLTFPAFPFKVKMIKVYGTSSASGSVKQNIFVGDDPISTETTGAKDVTNVYTIPSAYQAIGTVYVLKVTSAHNTQISKIEILGDGEAVAVSAAGLATFASDNKLDFTNVPDIEAYIAKEDAGAIKLTRVYKVAADTGVLLRAKNGTTAFGVPTTTDDADDPTGNLFVRGEGSAVASGSGPYNYILNNGSAGLGFYRAAGQTVATNRAYLQTTIKASAPFLNFNFDGEATGIENVKGETITNNEYYNLNGQRVAQPTKGLYIVNGRKVVIK